MDLFNRFVSGLVERFGRRETQRPVVVGSIQLGPVKPTNASNATNAVVSCAGGLLAQACKHQ